MEEKIWIQYTDFRNYRTGAMPILVPVLVLKVEIPVPRGLPVDGVVNLEF